MTIHREGYKSIGIAGLIFIVVSYLAFTFLSYSLPWLAWLIFFVMFFLFLFIVSFFRVPNRKLTINPHQIISPADGTIVTIEEVYDEEYFKDKRLQVSIFMSPANVHLNRNPISGKVMYSKYHKGKYLVAWHPKSSTENERHSVVLKNDKIELLVKQIAGALAKRIVNYLHEGDHVTQSEELGFIKFGSRVDLLLPLGTKIKVKLKDTVKSGVSVIADI
jgi:phosphatidylserine decarboxylase